MGDQRPAKAPVEKAPSERREFVTYVYKGKGFRQDALSNTNGPQYSET